MYVVSRRLIKDHLIMSNVNRDTIEISNQMILDVKLSRLKYESHLKE